MTTLASPTHLLSALGVLPRSRKSRPGAVQAGLLSTWIRRHRSRADLRALDAHMLRDIGLDWAEAAAEAQKPFWRA